MKKRNFILLIVVLIILSAVVLSFLSFKNPDSPDSPGGGGFLSDFSLFGKKNKDAPADTPTDISDYRDESIKVTPKLVLTRVSDRPVSGYTSFMKERFVEVPAVAPGTVENPATPTAPATEFVPALRYMERATGNVYQTYADRISERKFTDTPIPRVYEAYFGKNGDSVVARYIRGGEEAVASFVGKLPIDLLGADNSTAKIEGSFLPDNVTDVAISPDEQEIFYIYNVGQNAIGITAGGLGENKAQVLDIPYTEWLALWPNKDVITLATKPSGRVQGYIYEFNPRVKEFRKVLGGIFGLTGQMSPDARLLLYSNSNLGLSIYNISNNEIRTLGIKTLPEKCTWSKDSTTIYCAVPKVIDPALYPDDWYQGEVSFEDRMWKVELGNFTETLIIDLKQENGLDIDSIKPSLSDNEDYLFLVNKKDSLLWELRLR